MPLRTTAATSDEMEAVRLFKLLNRDQRNTFVACFLGWALDALDFFLVTFVLVPIGHDFGQTIPKVAFAITLTLMMRPLGAFIFGLLGDKFGRRIPLMADIIFYSVMELLTAFAPSFTVFLVLRALFGIGMGGEWGLGASLAMESLPTQTRGLFTLAGAGCLSRARCRHFWSFISGREFPNRRSGNATAFAVSARESRCRSSLGNTALCSSMPRCS